MAASPAMTGGSPEFVDQLYRGGELLTAGKVIEAKDHLERAYQLDPGNEKAQNLLGLSYFKLGMFDRASEIYETLVRDNPADPTLRVNLGLVYLKSGALRRAVREFEISTELQPDHQKAHNYLGLALAQMGEFGRARDHFVQAGSEAMAEKMSRALEEASARSPSLTPRHGDDAALEAARSQPVESAARAGHERVQASAPERGVEVPIEDGEGEAGPSEAAGAQARAAGQALLSKPPSGATRSGEGGDESAPVATPSERPHRFASGRSMRASGIEEVSVDVVETSAANDPLQAQDWGAQLPASNEEMEIRFAADEGPSLATPPAEAPETAAVEAAQEEAPSPAPAAAAAVSPAPQEEPEPLAEASQAAEQSESESAPVLEPILLTPLDRKKRVMALAPRVDFPDSGPSFDLAAEGVRVRVREELRIRGEGLVASWGELEFTPELRRHHGRATEHGFGAGARRMLRVRGEGALHVEKGGHVFAVLTLRDEGVYLREDVVFGLGDGISFENGRLPSGEQPVELVSASGEGQVLLRLPGELRAVEVSAARPLRIPLSAWVGWNGAVTANVVALGPEGRPAAELTGEGFALITVAVR